MAVTWTRMAVVSTGTSSKTANTISRGSLQDQLMNRMQAVHILRAYNKVMDKGKIFWPEQLERWSEKLRERTGNQEFNF